MINVRFDGLRRVDIFLGDLASDLLDFRPLWREIIREAVIPETEDVFSSDGRGTWAERVIPVSHPILRKSGRLLRSYTQEGHPENINRQSRTRLEWGSSVPYADAHEYGVPGRNLVARPVIRKLAEGSLDQRIERIIDRHFQERINRLRGA